MADKTAVVFKIDDLVQQNNQQKSIVQPITKKYIEDKQEDQLIASKENTVIDDIALIQSFWGVDQDRIIACNTALKKMVSMTTKPKDWIFVEAQKNKSDAAFGWVKHLGIKYIFRKIPKESEGIFLKMPLWNIGVSNTKCKRLCFIDSDIYFENSNWLDHVNEILGKKYDVIQLHAYAKQDEKDDQVESLGHVIMNHILKTGENTGFKFGHGGYTLGITRYAYDMIGKFDAVPRLADQWFWATILGYSKDSFLVLPYHQCVDDTGYPFSIGSAENIIVHITHVNNKNIYDLTVEFSYNHTTEKYENIIYNDKSLLPVWKDDIFSQSMKKCFIDLQNNAANINSYYFYLNENMHEQYPNLDFNLVITTLWYPDYFNNDSTKVLIFKDMLDKTCLTPFQFICLSNEEIYGIKTISYNEYHNNIRKTKKECIEYIFNNHIKYPHRSSVLYLDVNTVFNTQFEVIRCIDTKPVNSHKYNIGNNGIYCYIP